VKVLGRILGVGATIAYGLFMHMMSLSDYTITMIPKIQDHERPPAWTKAKVCSKGP
jgi:hypothetical protein